MKVFVVLWVNCGLKQGKKYVLQHLGKIRDQLFGFENITGRQKAASDHDGNLKSSDLNYCVVLYFSWCAEHLLYSGHLDHPAHVWRVHFVVNEPLRETVPFFWTGAIDGKPWFCMLVLTLLQITGHFLLKAQRLSALIYLSITVFIDTFMMRAK